MRTAAVILAAGRGTRMKSTTPKVLHPLAGKPLVEYAVETMAAVSGSVPILVIGHGAAQMRAALGDRVDYAVQEPQLGTGHAVLQARERLAGQADLVLVSCADMPLLTAATLGELLAAHRRASPALTLLTVLADDARGFGRVVRDDAGKVRAVVEEVDCTPEQLAIRELNAAVYCFDAAWLWASLPDLPLSRKGEYYLTDLVAMAAGQGRSVQGIVCRDAGELLGINSRVHLAEAEAALRGRINRRWMEAGVTLVDPATTYIDAGVAIGPDTTILPGTHLHGATAIGSGCRIGPTSMIQDSRIGDGCAVVMSVLEGAVMEDGSNVGPFSHLRPGAHLLAGAHVGNFGELKNSTLGPGAKMGHFSYLGDAQVGAQVNIGAGTITCNFDGVRKHATVIEEGAFIGSDSMLVAPVCIGRGAVTGAGSVVTHDVPPGAIAYGVPARIARPKEDPEA